MPPSARAVRARVAVLERAAAVPSNRAVDPRLHVVLLRDRADGARRRRRRPSATPASARRSHLHHYDTRRRRHFPIAREGIGHDAANRRIIGVLRATVRRRCASRQPVPLDRDRACLSNGAPSTSTGGGGGGVEETAAGAAATLRTCSMCCSVKAPSVFRRSDLTTVSSEGEH